VSDDSRDETAEDETAQAMRAALSSAVADMPVTTMSWDDVTARTRRTIAVRRTVAIGVSLVAIVGLVTVALATTAGGPRRGISVVGSDTTTSSPGSTPGRGAVPGDALSFREVQWSTPFGRASSVTGEATTAPSSAQIAASCSGGQLVTPPSQQKPAATIVLADRQKSACYLLGPILLTGRHIATAVPVQNVTTAAWEVNVHFSNDDFVQKVASPYTGRQIAIILGGIVESAPTIDAGITGQDIAISGSFDEASALSVARSIVPVGVNVSSPTTVTPSADERLLEEFSQRCAAVAPRLKFGAFSGTSMISAATARAMFGRAHEQVPPSLANVDDAERLALCEGVASTSAGVTPTTRCPDGQAYEAGPTLLYAVDAKLHAIRLPGLQYFIPAGSAATVPPPPC
jgi:hypothetical protein